MISVVRDWLTTRQAFLLLGAVLVLVGIFLRLYRYEWYPFAGDADELAYAWAGSHLWSEGKPVTWSTFGAYEERELIWYEGRIGKDAFTGSLDTRLVEPSLDHPFGFAAIIGKITQTAGYGDFSIYPSGLIRLPMLIVALLGLLGMYLLLYELSPDYKGLVALLFYVFTPTYIFASRLVQPENILAVLLIWGIWGILKYDQAQRWYWYGLIFGMSVVALWFKVTGVMLVPLFGFLLWWQGYRKQALGLLVALSMSVGGLMVYGWGQGWELFWMLLSQQGRRPVGFSQFVHMVTHPVVTNLEFLDGWWFLGLFGAVARLIVKIPRSERVLDVAFWWWVGVLLLTAGQGDALGWYRIPLYPLTAYFAGWLVVKIFQKPSLGGMLVLFATLLTSITLQHMNYGGAYFRLLVLVVMVVPLLALLTKKQGLVQLQRGIIVLMLIAGIVLNSLLVARIYPISCYMRECVIPSQVEAVP